MMEPTHAVDCSVVILNWNKRQLIRRSLEALHGVPPSRYRLEVIVVDNGSTDGSQEMVRTEYPVVRLIENMVNLGIAEGKNVGLGEAQGRLILLLDDDTTVLPSQLDTLIETMSAHPEAGIVTCMKVDARGRPLYTHHIPSPAALNLRFFLVTELSLVEMGRMAKRFIHWNGGAPHESKEIVEIPYIGGAIMLVRGDAVHDVGLMDGNIFFYGEDFDWCYRFRQHGWKILYVPKIRVVSGYGVNAIRTKRASLAALGSRRYLFEKHVGRRYLPLYAAIALAGLFPKLTYYTLHDLRRGARVFDIPTTRWFVDAVRCILGARSVPPTAVTSQRRHAT